MKSIIIENGNNWFPVLLTDELLKSWYSFSKYLLLPLSLLPESWFNWLIIKLQVKFLNLIGKKYSSNTFGGFLENRASLIGFLEPACTQQIMIHLGIDINNIMPGIPIKVPCNVRVVHTFIDKSPINGWGGRIIMEMEQEYKGSKYLLYGHLNHDLPVVGDTFTTGQIIGYLGNVYENGGWFPHLHVQCITQKMFDEYHDNLNNLDGYIFKHVNYQEYVSDPTFLVFKK